MAKPVDLAHFTVNPERLTELDTPALQALWAACCPKLPPAAHRCLLLRDLAFVIQSNGLLGLPRETDALVRAAMKQTSVTRSPEADKKAARTRPPTALATQGVPVGAQLMREWGGTTHKVKVLGGGWYQYHSQSYKSLTQVAKAITGAHWSGPRFFGLHNFREPT